jgi:hypothetical protein
MMSTQSKNCFALAAARTSLHRIIRPTKQIYDVALESEYLHKVDLFCPWQGTSKELTTSASAGGALAAVIHLAFEIFRRKLPLVCGQ